MGNFNWDFLKSHVDAGRLPDDPAVGARGQNFFSGESAVMCAGPSLASRVDPIFSNLYPLGTTDAIQIANSTNVIQLWEIGSKVPYIVRGRTVTQLNLSKVLFNGDSILAALTTSVDSTEDSGVYLGTSDPNIIGSAVGAPGSKFKLTPNDAETSGRFYLNLASQFFNTPFGLALLFKDSDGDWVAAFYAENCVIQQDSMTIQGQNLLIMESASIRTTGLVPLTLVV